MSQFINAKETLVTEAIDGMLRHAGGRLARLDGYPHIKVVVRNDWDRSRVALVSGGGSGHEPSHAGFVGQGMLTAAVCGEVFASPSVDAVLAGILAVTGKAGCLLIVKNYTGDRLNFGLAAERARAQGLSVRMVIVDDDVALPDLPQPRGVAGALFVHKIAGALAEAGADLDSVTGAARRVIDGTDDPFRARAAELLFREQNVTLKDGAILLGDRETVEMLAATAGMGALGQVMSIPGSVMGLATTSAQLMTVSERCFLAKSAPVV